MPEPFKVLQIGFGTIGGPIAKAIIERENLELMAVIDVNPDLHGKSVEEIMSIDSETSTVIHSSIDAALGKDQTSPPDVALVMTLSDLEKVSPTIIQCLSVGMHVVSICEELSYPFERHPELSKKIDAVARDAGKAVLGTGINPGYLMDLLPIVSTAPLQQVDTIHVTRVIDSAKRRASFQKKVGTSMSEDEFKVAIENKVITGHVGLVESMRMISDALGMELDHFEEFPPEAIIASEETVTSFATVEAGKVLGLKSRGIAEKNGKTIITLDFIAHAGASPEFDEIEIEGYPNLTQRIEGGVMGDYGTAAMAMNMIPLVAQSPPGLYTMKDLPVPRNTQRFWKNSD
ncbi:MAG: dihydrodipicolinate reductase [Candidatus Thorarchaeota archaeon]|nr:MAG: dihydrodipicolinate reductase [Candidatus Thorarchaeota archaeon]